MRPICGMRRRCWRSCEAGLSGRLRLAVSLPAPEWIWLSPGLPRQGHSNPGFIRDALSYDKGAANQTIRKGS
jgi:hypothetical protein